MLQPPGSGRVCCHEMACCETDSKLKHATQSCDSQYQHVQRAVWNLSQPDPVPSHPRTAAGADGTVFSCSCRFVSSSQINQELLMMDRISVLICREKKSNYKWTLLRSFLWSSIILISTFEGSEEPFTHMSWVFMVTDHECCPFRTTDRNTDFRTMDSAEVSKCVKCGQYVNKIIDQSHFSFLEQVSVVHKI